MIATFLLLHRFSTASESPLRLRFVRLVFIRPNCTWATAHYSCMGWPEAFLGRGYLPAPAVPGNHWLISGYPAERRAPRYYDTRSVTLAKVLL